MEKKDSRERKIEREREWRTYPRRADNSRGHGGHGGACRVHGSTWPGQATLRQAPQHPAPLRRGPRRRHHAWNLWKQRDRHGARNPSHGEGVGDELEQRQFQIDADEKDRRHEAVRLRPMARAMTVGVRRNQPATARATQVAREKGIRVRRGGVVGKGVSDRSGRLDPSWSNPTHWAPLTGGPRGKFGISQIL
jgi:hypothetical protein